jgi:type IV pilus assembly protein PilX
MSDRYAMHIRSLPSRQRGAALVVGLVLLLIMTLLGITGMSSSTVDLAMAGNSQNAQNSFQAAESTIEVELRLGASGTGAPRVDENYDFGNGTHARAETAFQATRLPPPGYSLTEYQADHYAITSTGTAARSASSTHLQGFYVVVPNGS